MGRKKIYTDREIQLAKLWHKLARSTFAIIDYDVHCIYKYVPKLNKSEIKKLKTACSKAIDEALRRK